MARHSTLLLAAGITAFLLVLVGGVTLSVAQKKDPPLPTPVAPSVSNSSSSTSSTPRPASSPRTDAMGTRLHKVSPEDAVELALTLAPGTSLVRMPEMIDVQGTIAYSVQLDGATVYVDADNGRILHTSYTSYTSAGGAATSENAGADRITRDQAVQIATAYVGGGMPVKVERDDEHGVVVWEVKLDDGSKVYVDITSGQVVYSEIEDDHKGDSKRVRSHKEADDD